MGVLMAFILSVLEIYRKVPFFEIYLRILPTNKDNGIHAIITNDNQKKFRYTILLLDCCM